MRQRISWYADSGICCAPAGYKWVETKTTSANRKMRKRRITEDLRQRFKRDSIKQVGVPMERNCRTGRTGGYRLGSSHGPAGTPRPAAATAAKDHLPCGMSDDRLLEWRWSGGSLSAPETGGGSF